MSKKIIGLLLAVCLVVGLLPMVAFAAGPADATIKFGFSSIKLTAFDTPVYTKNYEKPEAKDTEGNTFSAWAQTSTGADESNYNAKYEWKTGEEGPTLTLRGFKFDEYNNATGKLIGKVEDGEYTTTAVQTYAITCSKNVPLKIVITGEDSLIETKFGITYYNDTTIVSEGASKLTINGRSSCIASNNTAGADLTINANLDLTLGSFYNSNYAGAVIRCYNADMVINGGNIDCKIEQTDAKGVAGIQSAGGNLTINDGNITATSIVGAGATNGCITATGGKLTINGGNVTANPKRAVGFYGKTGIEINGGTVNATSPYYCFNAGTTDDAADVVINGGTVTCNGKAFYGKAPILGTGVEGFAGSSEEEADYFDETKYNATWAKFVGASAPSTQPTTPPTQAPTTEPTTKPTEAPTTKPTEAPTQATQAPTTATQAPTQATQGQNPSTGDNGIAMFAAMMLVAVFGIVAVVSFGKKHEA